MYELLSKDQLVMLLLEILVYCEGNHNHNWNQSEQDAGYGQLR